ncbi:MAG: hypothetical protein H7124_18205 [Phycisphaerales bacterium]|nr:hypothetical protein [Hyphomonadaceae bacterium]
MNRVSSVVRIGLGIVVGVALGLGVVIAGDTINHALFPPPHLSEWENYVATAPFAAFIGLPIAYALAAFAAAFAGAKIAARIWAGWVSGGLLTAATFANLVMVHHPLWMTIACIVLVPLAAWFGAKLAAAPARAQPLTQ